MACFDLLSFIATLLGEESKGTEPRLMDTKGGGKSPLDGEQRSNEADVHEEGNLMIDTESSNVAKTKDVKGTACF